MTMRVDAVCLCALAVAGCSSSAVGPDAVMPPAIDGASIDTPPTMLPPDRPPHMSGTPGLGAHGLAFSHLGNDTPHPMPIVTPAMATHASGSMIIVSIGRGNNSLFVLPTDTKGNAPYQQVGTMQVYTDYKNSGTALYAFPSAAGGADFQVRAATDDVDEITIAAVEIVEGTRIQAHAWNEAAAAAMVTSASVTTTGAATLVAFWWGEANQYFPKTAVPNNGFSVIDSVLEEGSLVQCAVAVKDVAAAGTYNVGWEATPAQGAQLWLIAVQ